MLTIVLVSVIVAVGVSLLDITIKQLTLSGTSRDSEVAFHAAYAGAECAHHARVTDLDQFKAAGASLASCLENTTAYTADYHEETANNHGVTPSADVHHSFYSITWGPSSDKCTQIDVYVYDALTAGSDVTFDIRAYKPNFDITIAGSDIETCDADNVCTYILSRGYNRSCTDLASFRTIQREVVLEL